MVLASQPNHLSDGLDSAPGSAVSRGRAAHHPESQMLTRLGDQLSIGVLADQHPDVRPTVVVGREEQVLVPEGVNVSALEVGLVWVEVRSQGLVTVTQGSNQQPHHKRGHKGQQPDQPGTPDFHNGFLSLKRGLPGPERWRQVFLLRPVAAKDLDSGPCHINVIVGCGPVQL